MPTMGRRRVEPRPAFRFRSENAVRPPRAGTDGPGSRPADCAAPLLADRDHTRGRAARDLSLPRQLLAGTGGRQRWGGPDPARPCPPWDGEGSNPGRHSGSDRKMLSDRLEQALTDLEADLRIALLHYSPIETTLEGERLEIYPFLGSYLLAQAVDNAGADLILHGHAHHGTEKGRTPAGIPVQIGKCCQTASSRH